MPAVDTSTPTRPAATGKNWVRKIGNNTIKAAPKKLPMMEPMPPMMTMNSNLKDWSTENAAGSQAPRYIKAHKAPDTPTIKELTAKALSLANMGRMPITAAATSMSRIAIHSRPTAPRTRFLASKAITANMTRQNRYLASGVSSAMPNTCRLETDTEPEVE